MADQFLILISSTDIASSVYTYVLVWFTVIREIQVQKYMGDLKWFQSIKILFNHLLNFWIASYNLNSTKKIVLNFLVILMVANM